MPSTIRSYTELIGKLDELAEIKKSIEDSKTTLTDITTKLDKVKIPHLPADIRNVVYVVKYGSFNWVKDADNRIDFIPTVSGTYRFTVISLINFKVTNQLYLMGDEWFAILSSLSDITTKTTVA